VRTILLVALCVAIDAQADPQVWVNPGIYSLHFDRDKDLRDDNIGLGVELVMAPEHAASAGTFINSNRARSRYLAYAWRPLRWELRGVDVALGVVAGAFDGYPNYRDGGWFVAPLPLLAVEGRRLGVNLSVIPTIRDRLDGALAIQLKLRVW
jgi:hypothetical protein